MMKVLPDVTMSCWEQFKCKARDSLIHRGIHVAPRSLDRVWMLARQLVIRQAIETLFFIPTGRYTGKKFEWSMLLDMKFHMFDTYEICVFAFTSMSDEFIDQYEGDVQNMIRDLLPGSDVSPENRFLRDMKMQEDGREVLGEFQYNYYIIPGESIESIINNMNNKNQSKIEAGKVADRETIRNVIMSLLRRQVQSGRWEDIGGGEQRENNGARDEYVNQEPIIKAARHRHNTSLGIYILFLYFIIIYLYIVLSYLFGILSYGLYYYLLYFTVCYIKNTNKGKK